MDPKTILNQSAWSKIVDVVFIGVVGFLIYTKRIPMEMGLGLFALFQTNRGAVGVINKLINGGTVQGSNPPPPPSPPSDAIISSTKESKPGDGSNALRIITPDALRNSTVLFSIVSMIEGVQNIGGALLKNKHAFAACILVVLGLVIKG